MPLGVVTAIQAHPRGPHYGRIAVLAEDDTDNGEAPTVSQEPRPARRLVLVGGRSGEGVEARNPEWDPLGHVVPMQTVQSQMEVQILWQECPVRARQRRLRFLWGWGCRQCAHQSPLNVQDLVKLIIGHQRGVLVQGVCDAHMSPVLVVFGSL